jgi:hypothetical protein
MPSLASSPSLRHHPTTHWPHRRTATTTSKHSCSQPPPCGSSYYQFPVPRSPSTAIPLPGDLGRKCQLLYGSKCSSLFMVSHLGTKATAKLVAQRFVLPGVQKDCSNWNGLASPASTPKPPATHSIGGRYAAGSPFPALLHRPSDVSGLQILPYYSRPFHPLAGSRPHPGHHSRHRGTRSHRLYIPLRLSANHQDRTGTSV